MDRKGDGVQGGFDEVKNTEEVNELEGIMNFDSSSHKNNSIGVVGGHFDQSQSEKI